MNVLITVCASLLWIAFFRYAYVREKKTGLHHRFLLLSGYRFLFLFIQISIYTWFYDGICDSLLFHEKLTTIWEAIKNNPSDLMSFYSGSYSGMSLPVIEVEYLNHEPRVVFFLKILLPFFVLSAGSYVLICLWITLIGTMCFTAFLAQIKTKESVLIWYLVFLIPSISFWTTGIFKEAFVVPLFFLLFSWIQSNTLGNRQAWVKAMLFIVCFYMAWNIKYYFAAAFLVFCLGYLFITRIKRLIPALGILISCVVMAVILFGYLHPNLEWNVLPQAVTANYLATCNNSIPEKCISFSLDGSWYSIVKNIPGALVYVMYSPTIFQVDDLTTVLAAIESHLLLFTLLYTVYVCLKERRMVERAEVILFLFVLIIGVFLIMSSPNLGSFSRYRVFYLPVYGYLLFKYSRLYRYVPFINRLNSSGSK